MGWFSSDIDTFDELFVHTLQDIYYAEHQIEKSLPGMIEKASDAELKKAFRMHLKQTRGQIKRLDRVFKMIKSIPQGTKCPAIDGIIKEADEVAGEVADKSVLDAALINAAQAAEHYEITRYGSLIAWAKQLGRSDCAGVLQKTLDEERATDKKLTTLAESRWVSGISAAAAPPMAALIPGTTSTRTPAAAQASASSPPRPKIKGSPPFSRTTSWPLSASATNSALI